MDGILMMSAKLTSIALLNIKAFWYKGYDVIVSAHDATNRISSVMWPKFGNSSITMTDVITTLIL